MRKPRRDLRRRAVSSIQTRERFAALLREADEMAARLGEKAELAERRGDAALARQLLDERDRYLSRWAITWQNLQEASAASEKIKEEIRGELERLQRRVRYPWDDRYLPKPFAVTLLTLYALLAVLAVLHWIVR